MAFHPNDRIVHPRHGAGTLTGIRTVERDGETCRYYCIKLVDDQSTVMIPDDYINDAGLRLALTDTDMINTVMSNDPQQLSDDYRSRQAQVRDLIQSGEPRQIICALRDLCWYEVNNRLNTTDTRLKLQAQKLIASELAVKAALDFDTALERLERIVKLAMKAHQTVQQAAADNAQ
ncbi:MAG: hypothetical protein JW910_03360 [Anaerolineae bacterium]|nr:hypothetical protein [Anaerolineae bacterium]